MVFSPDMWRGNEWYAYLEKHNIQDPYAKENDSEPGFIFLMCGVIGCTILNFSESDVPLVEGLFRETMIRGKTRHGRFVC